MNLVETIVVFAVIPLAIYGAVGLATLRKKSAGISRYRPGQPWEYPAIWWSANPEGLSAGHPHAGVDTVAASDAAPTAAGGARAQW
ncbi:aa3-type cytochrome oxidase subunit CtaJ [Amycolatopsis sp. H20-H5]|uniref:aa3-type cytochrome oxidase subunit CtaJ n=1 Tax=Amycolatopsis sp. H20-H5 TaxID=3046309 RepID=UPI002DBC0013|nr:hypothetical protein [Amycolatopsis sp. H20-H5]MEC3978447.1 hypothetical protein [Amycolatopsis sp. H20-H5]